MLRRVVLSLSVLLGCTALMARTDDPVAAQVNSQAPPQTDLPVPRPSGGGMPRGGVQTGPMKTRSMRCYTKASPPKPKGCVYPEPHDVGEMCTCSLDGGEVPGTFLE